MDLFQVSDEGPMDPQQTSTRRFISKTLIRRLPTPSRLDVSLHQGNRS